MRASSKPAVAYDPAGQFVQIEADAVDVVPVPHVWQVEYPLPLHVPALHAGQLDEPEEP